MIVWTFMGYITRGGHQNAATRRGNTPCRRSMPRCAIVRRSPTRRLMLPRIQAATAWCVVPVAHVCEGSEVKMTAVGWSERRAQARATRKLQRYQRRAAS